MGRIGDPGDSRSRNELATGHGQLQRERARAADRAISILDDEHPLGRVDPLVALEPLVLDLEGEHLRERANASRISSVGNRDVRTSSSDPLERRVVEHQPPLGRVPREPHRDDPARLDLRDDSLAERAVPDRVACGELRMLVPRLGDLRAAA